jgi:hypothetical protein
MTTTTEKNHAAENAAAWLDKIEAMVTKYYQARCSHTIVPVDDDNTCEDCGALFDENDYPAEPLDEDATLEAITESPLSVMVRSGWYVTSENAPTPAEYEIILSTGGPALRIVGDLDHNAEPRNARLEYRDWGTPWTYHAGFNATDREPLLTFARCFSFGEAA